MDTLEAAQLRETIDALNSTGRALHALGDAVHRLETSQKESHGKYRVELQEAVVLVRESLKEVSARVLALETATTVQSQVEEKTDAFRREVFDRTGKVLSSKPAWMVYAILTFFFLQTLGIKVSPDLKRWVAQAILGIPVAVEASPSTEHVDDAEGSASGSGPAHTEVQP